MGLNAAELAGRIDHTLLRPEATLADINQVCREAIKFNFCAVCVHPYYVPQIHKLLHGSEVKTGSVAGFPYGMNCTADKISEANNVLTAGAEEVDMVLNIGALKDRNDDVVRRDIAGVAAACHEHGAILKVIFETCLLTDEEKVRACKLAVEAEADFVKTSTGFQGGGATVEDIRLMSAAVKEAGLGVKAAGGIRTYEQACALVEAGATRLGTSAGVSIVQEARTAQ